MRTRLTGDIPHSAMNEVFTFSPNANGVGAIYGSFASARTPLALRLNVSYQVACDEA